MANDDDATCAASDANAAAVLLAALPGEDSSVASVEPSEETIAKLTAKQDARNTKLRRAGRFAGQGYPIQWIADRFGENVSTVRQWRDDPAFLEGYSAAEGAAARDAALQLTKIALSLPELIDVSIAVAKDTTHKDSSVERRFLIDKILIPMTAQHVRHDAADPKAVGVIADALKGIAALAPQRIPDLVDGKSAAAQYGALPGEAPVVDAEVVPETKQ